MMRWEVVLLVAIAAALVSEGESWSSRRRRSCSPVSCAVSSWQWSPCSKSCGTGEQEGLRQVTRNPSCGGNGCPSLRTTRVCNTQCCAQDCQVTDWKDWSQCSATCGEQGHQSRVRGVSVKETCGGSCTVILNEKRSCNRHCCPVNCTVGSWDDWTSCSESCGTRGEQLRTRDVVTPATCQGECPYHTDETRSCNRQCCPQNCFVSEWGKWDKCTATCGTDGMKTRRREIVQAASCNGTCVALIETAPCNRECCPKNCKVSAWTNYTSCSASCGDSTKRRSRVVTEASACGGECKDELEQVTKCEVPCCKRDCAVGYWSAWDECSDTCGSNGTQIRRRGKTVSEECGGMCSFRLTETQSCNRLCCPVHCEIRWSPWSECQCDNTERRFAAVVRQHECKGRPCPKQMSEVRKCKKPSKCIHGVCGKNGVCHCSPGHMGRQCENKCPLGLYGRDCKQICEECPKRSCHHQTGVCTCPLMTYGSKCQYKHTCGNHYECASAASLSPAYAQCYIRSSKHYSHSLCPHSHHVSRCHCYKGCHPKTILSSRLCHCECNPPSFWFFTAHYAAAVCCPEDRYKPIKAPPEPF